MKTGIVGYGSYIPKYRITSEEIANVWGQDPEAIRNGLGIIEKSVPGKDEDTVTISVQAARNALARAGIKPTEIGAIYVGSESHPYAVKTTSAIVGQALGVGTNYTAADTEFACKAGSAGMQIGMGLVGSEMCKYVLAIGADTSQAAAGDALEYSASAGGAAYIIGRDKKEFVAGIVDTLSYTSDTPDFWRRGTQKTPRHAGRFTGEPAYFKHLQTATKNMMEKVGMKPSDFDYVVFHQPNAKFPSLAAKTLGFTKEQIEPGLLVKIIGNTYSGASMLGLAATLDIAKAGQRILVTSYGSGSGSDSFVIETTNLLEEKRKKAKLTKDYVERKKYLNYSAYQKHMEEIH